MGLVEGILILALVVIALAVIGWVRRRMRAQSPDALDTCSAGHTNGSTTSSLPGSVRCSSVGERSRATAPRRGPDPRAARCRSARPAGGASRARAGLLGPRPRRLAGDAPRPVHRGDARRRPLHRRRPAVLDRPGRGPEHAVARRRRAQASSRPVRLGPARPRGARALHARGRRRGRPIGRGADAAAGGPRSGATWPGRWP